MFGCRCFCVLTSGSVIIMSLLPIVYSFIVVVRFLFGSLELPHVQLRTLHRNWTRLDRFKMKRCLQEKKTYFNITCASNLKKMNTHTHTVYGTQMRYETRVFEIFAYFAARTLTKHSKFRIRLQRQRIHSIFFFYIYSKDIFLFLCQKKNVWKEPSLVQIESKTIGNETNAIFIRIYVVCLFDACFDDA